MSISNPATTPAVLFFDAAGTLFHTTEPVGDTYTRVAARHGATLDAVLLHEGFKTIWAAAVERTDEAVPSHGDDRDWWREIVRGAVASHTLPPAFPFEEWFEELYLHFAKPEAWTLFPDVLPALELLRQRGHRMAILSNLDSRLRPVLTGHGLAPYFEKLFISAELGTAKPSPTIYRRALQAMHCTPGEAWMIGDEPEKDIAIPRSLGMNAYHLDRPKTDLLGLERFLVG